jgi:hypothetical protein
MMLASMLLTLVRGGNPPAPPGFTLAAGYCVGDSSTTSKNCLNPPQQMGNKPCGADCFKTASADCLADDTCSAFAYMPEHPTGKYETFNVGLANVVANADWTTYAKPLLCCQCPDGAWSLSRLLLYLDSP